MRARSETLSFSFSMLLNLAAVYVIGTAIAQAPQFFHRIEVDLTPPPPPLVRPKPPPPPPPPEMVKPRPLPKPLEVPKKREPIKTVQETLKPEEAPPQPTAPALPRPKPPPVPLRQSLRIKTFEAGPNPAATAPAAPALPGSPSGAAAAPLHYPGPLPGRVDPAQAYYASVLARIEAAKRYPRLAQLKRAEGKASVSFRLDSQGNLLEAALCDSSGDSSLDQAALAAVQRGAPYPPYPGDAGPMPETFEVTVAFVLR